MTFPKARVVVTGLLFVGWLAYLLLLALETRQTVVLSRPQLLVADLCVVAEVKDKDGAPDPEAEVLRVLWSTDPGDEKLVGENLLVANLPDVAAPQGYAGAGKYLLPLSRLGPAQAPHHVVTAVPSSPGYEPLYFDVELHGSGERPEQAARVLAEFLGVSEAEALEEAKKRGPILERNVPHKQAVAFQLRMKAAGAEVGLRTHDTRVYPATAQTLDQLEQFRR